MAGATAVQIVSALLQHGPGRLADIRREFEQWGDEHEYESIEQMRGSMSLVRCPNPEGFERGNYLRILQSWHRPGEARHDYVETHSGADRLQ
jgi:dihydroorotate dehydrogenase (fumarate)